MSSFGGMERGYVSMGEQRGLGCEGMVQVNEPGFEVYSM